MIAQGNALGKGTHPHTSPEGACYPPTGKARLAAAPASSDPL